MMRSLAPTAVFDLDGTLADTAPDLVATLNAVLAREGLPALPLAEAREMIGHGARALIERGLEAAGREATPDHLDELYRFFLAYYAENLCVETRLFPGVVKALDHLDAEGFRLAVCTNKVKAHSVKLLEALGLAHRFTVICGRDSFPYVKPDPRHLTLTIEAAGGSPRHAIMVGDSRTDIVTAKTAKIPVIAVTFGYTDVPVRQLGPDLVIDHYDELAGAVRGLVPSGRAAPSAVASAL
ncbi:MAG TPA: phosphoglycolate phosphatase [Beijerinckiaceae bacterium]|nr:phosphoglycolate phosphatase [Beijerinckiaceae bacterium]